MPKNILTSYTFSTGGNTITSHSASIIPLAIRSSSTTPTSDLLSIQTNGGTPLSGFDSAANLFVNKTSYGTSIVSSGPANVTFWKIATLPVSTAGSYDHLVLDVVLDDNWGSAQKVTARIVFSNRDAFTFRYYLNGTVRSAARVLAYTEANGTVSIYLRAGNGNYCTFSYNITHGVDANLSIPKNPASTTTTPTGTLAFDSSAIGTYVPESYIPYTGQPIIRGLVNSSGTISGASFVRTGGTTAQFLKANGDVDSNTYLPTTSSYFAGHHPEGRIMHNAYLTNDFANARLRGSTVSATQNGVAYTISNADWDAMFDGTASFFNLSPTSGFTFPLVLTVSLPRTLTYGTWVGIGFGNSGWRANSVKIEVFSLNSSSWVTVLNTTTNTSEDVFTAVSGLSGGNSSGINQIRYTLANPNSTQLRIAHIWGYNFNSDMWSQTMMPRAGGAVYGALSAPSLAISGGGTYAAGSIYSDSNWGMLFRAHRASPVNAQYRWANSSDTELMRLDNSGRLIVSNTFSGSTQGTAQIEARTLNATTVGTIVRGFGTGGSYTQTADLQQWQSFDGTNATIVAQILNTGAFVSAGAIRATGPIGSSSVGLGSIVSNAAGGHVVMQNAGASPNQPSGGGVLFVTSGALQYRGTSGSAATIVNADGTIPGGGALGYVGGYQTTSTAGSSVALTGINSVTSTSTLDLTTPTGTTTSALSVKTGNASGNSSGAILIQTGTTGGSLATTGSITIKTGDGASSGSTTGNIIIQTGQGSGSTGPSGNITIDAGIPSAATAGTISIGTANTSALTIGRTGVTTTINGTLALPSTAQQLFLASPTSGSGVPAFRYISTSDFTQSSSPTTGQALVAAPVTGGWSWQSFLSTSSGGSVNGAVTITGALNLDGASSPLQVQGSVGATGTVLTSAGAGATPTWSVPAASDYGVAWTGFASGYNYYAQGGAQSNGTNSLNNMTLVPFALSVSTTFTKIGIMVNTAGTGSTVRLGIYNSTNGIPSSRLLDAGTVATTTSSTLTLITINQTLAPGLYWLAAVNQGATCSSQIKGSGHVPLVPFLGSPANGTARGLQVTGVSGALPNPVGTLGMSTTPFEVFLQL
jgi:hypothetical protein